VGERTRRLFQLGKGGGYRTRRTPGRKVIDQRRGGIELQSYREGGGGPEGNTAAKQGGKEKPSKKMIWEKDSNCTIKAKCGNEEFVTRKGILENTHLKHNTDGQEMWPKGKKKIQSRRERSQ